MKRSPADTVAWILLGLLIALRLGVVPSVLTPPPIKVDAPSAVLIAELTGDQSALMQALPGIMHSKFKGRSRCIDDDTTAEAANSEAQWVRDALALPRQSSPWIVLATPTSGFSGPVPGTIEEASALLEKYAP